MLLPPGCDCQPLVLDVVRRARAAGVHPWLIRRGQDRPAADESAIATRRARGVVALDPDSALSLAFAASAPTLVLVHADGVIAAVEPAPQDSLPAVGEWLDDRLAGLLEPGVAPDVGAPETR
jgi:hypothetical protein